MKHKLSITLALLGLFLLAQLIGILVLNAYNQPISTSLNQTNQSQEGIKQLPFDLDETEESNIPSLMLSIILAFLLFFFLMKYDMRFIIKAWFYLVIVLALSVSLNAFIGNTIIESSILALIIAIPLATLKIFRPSVLIHNGTELLIYPGIAAIIAPIINVLGMIILLILIALYDAWAVWHSGIMQKMAKYQMEEVKIFGGFLIPHIDRKTKEKLKKLKQKYTKLELQEKLKKKRFRINVAILGGGDVVFPIIAMGVFMRTFPEASLFGVPGLVPALFILVGSFIALVHLFLITEKKKAYPAMPWISTGALLGMLAWWLTFVAF
ncbi:hypothetical protein CMI41_00535 [Candidatus Pacearchaeota archaeon]|nr:hypothetical protein [Candidatus Pacearchaeota archaeon]|tara:strand:+ start:637 stop:1608 length:972 start_codon:yes stop_codon:yes gene_type:complete